MSRLIDADALYETLCHIWDRTDSEDFEKAVFREIENAPVVEERKTGRWIFCDSDAERYDDIRCSVCGKHFTVDAERWCDIGFIASDLKYCPNCGADMRGEENDGIETVSVLRKQSKPQ